MSTPHRPEPDGSESQRTEPQRSEPQKAAPQKAAPPSPAHRELLDAAEAVARRFARADNHTVAAAARNADGRIVTALNAYHFTGGPCAELVVLGAAAGQGAYDLTAIVAVADRGRGVIPPCGRCRQVLLDYFPEIEVLVGRGPQLRAVPVRELLPEAYVWAGHQDG
ncbi:cytidine deaminase [Streptomyces kaniharaensis]|uniref:Cytidine deaminase n=1 Tax=Streptomyces kaniharaensis TaxID=212423 RepID=A0A6N7KYA8_9ACTN|nr:cytidine deaminase [Streptomyces kaniharaensis]MQS15238.1 cytidine deaminase [Streptomyces kaniharaensis]